jgi:hypothetical protein
MSPTKSGTLSQLVPRIFQTKQNKSAQRYLTFTVLDSF